MYTMQMFGLPGLVCTVSMNSPEGRPPIDVYGPKGLRRFLRTALELSRSILGFEYRVHELVHDIQPKEVVSGICLWYVCTSSCSKHLGTRKDCPDYRDVLIFGGG